MLTKNKFDDLLNETIRQRKEQDMVFHAAYQTDGYKLNIYENIIKNNTQVEAAKPMPMLEQIYPGDISKQGQFILCSHHDLSYNTNTIIYGEKTNNKINRQGLNEELFKQIQGTEVTKGMLKNAQGYKWQNGFIALGINCIFIRDSDNCYGQPGSMMGAFFYNKLGINVFEKDVVPQLVIEFNEKTSNFSSNDIEFNNLKLDPHDFMQFVSNTFKNVYDQKLKMLEDSEHQIDEHELFIDVKKSNLTRPPETFRLKRSIKNALRYAIISIRDMLDFALKSLD